MNGIKTIKTNANKLRNVLIKQKFMDREYYPIVKEDTIILPIFDNVTPKMIEKLNLEEKILYLKNLNFPKKILKSNSFVKEVHKILTTEEKPFFKKSFDVIGSIGIIEIHNTLQKKEKQIGNCLKQSYSYIKTVVKKVGACESQFRIQKYEYLCGVKTFQTVHKENGVKFKIQIDKVFFSHKISNERMRIAKLVKMKERVFVPFCGISPYPIILTRFSKLEKVVGIDLNPFAIKLSQENIKLNNFEKIIQILEGDVTKSIPKEYINYFDRIVIPMPRVEMKIIENEAEWEVLLYPILRMGKIGCFVHFYVHLYEDEILSFWKKMKERIKQKTGFIVNLSHWYKVGGQQLPKFYRICYDFHCK